MIFVTGHRGQLGSAICDVIRKNKAYNLLTTDIDLTVEDDVRNLFKENKIDVIINCAAFTDVDACETDSKNLLVNAYVPAMLSELAASRGSKFVQISSDYVYGDQAIGMINCEFPKNAYGMAKMFADMSVYLADRHRNLILRVQNLCSDKKGIIKYLMDGNDLKINPNVIIGPTSVYLLAEDIYSMIGKKIYGVHNYGPERCIYVSHLLKWVNPNANFSISYEENRAAKRKLDNNMNDFYSQKMLSNKWIRPLESHIKDIVERISNEQI